MVIQRRLATVLLSEQGHSIISKMCYLQVKPLRQIELFCLTSEVTINPLILTYLSDAAFQAVEMVVNVSTVGAIMSWW